MERTRHYISIGKKKGLADRFQHIARCVQYAGRPGRMTNGGGAVGFQTDPRETEALQVRGKIQRERRTGLARSDLREQIRGARRATAKFAAGNAVLTGQLP